MTHNLRDQLLGLGFKPTPKPERKPEAAHARPGGAEQGLPVTQLAGKSSVSPSTIPRSRRTPSGPPRQHAPPRPGSRAGGLVQRQGAGGKSRTQEDIDLAKAYAIRAQREKEERIAAEQALQEEARLRREARNRLAEVVKDQGLNAADAEIARHFPYGGKIKRIYVTPAQLKALNTGALGVLQMDGRYVLVTAELLRQAEGIFPPAIALKVDPDAPVGDDPYADPLYQVPDDLVW